MGCKSKMLSIVLLALVVTSIVTPIHSLANLTTLESLTELVLTVFTNKPSYLLGELVTIFGATQHLNGTPVEGATIAIEVKDPRGNTVFIDIAHSLPDGTYEDDFRLSTSSPSGQYNVYVTAQKTGYESATNEASFWASSEETYAILAIVGHILSLEPDDQVVGELNITMFSNEVNSFKVTNRLLVIDPTGTNVYDNFLGIGGPLDKKETTVYNGSVSTINFEFYLQNPISGYYTNLFAAYDLLGRSIYDSTSWSTAFMYTTPPVSSTHLGSLSAESSVSSSLALDLERFQTVQFSFTLTDHVEQLLIVLEASLTSRFIGTLTQDDLEAQNELYPSSPWTLQNVPSGTYNLIVTILSDYSSLTNILVESGQAISPSVEIVGIESTSFSATPGGKIGYYVSVEWRIIAGDTLEVTAELEGSTDNQQFSLSPLQYNSKDFYLEVDIPETPGTYFVNFEASLLNAGVFTQTSTPIEVQENEYNITIAPEVAYYRMPSAWEWVLGARGKIPVDDPSELDILSVTDIKIIDVGLQEGSPVNATIEFDARNKAGSWFSFGEGPHYDLWINDRESEFRIGLILAGQTETKRATLKLDPSLDLVFTIKFKMSLPAELMLLAESVFEVVVSAWTSGLTGSLLQAAGDIVTLTVLYVYKSWTESEHGYMTKFDMGEFFDFAGPELGSDLIKTADKIWGKNGRNPWFAVLDAVWTAYSEGKIDVIKVTNVLIRLFLWAVYRAASNWEKVITESFEHATIIYSAPLTATWTEPVKHFLKKLGIVFSFTKLIKIVYDLLVKPPEEGKIVASTLDTGQGVTFDPILAMNFTGPVTNTSISYFGDVSEVEIEAKQIDAETATGFIRFIVDPNVTSLYLPIVSDSTYQRNIFKSCGLNATSTSLQWQNGTNIFVLEANGSMFQGLKQYSFRMNETKLEGFQEMSVDAVQMDSIAFFNSSLIYPLGKNLTYTIQMTLPAGSENIQVLSGGNYTIQDNVITWNSPVDCISIKFAPPSWTTAYIGSGGYPIVDFATYAGKLYAASDTVLCVYDGTSWTSIDAPTCVLSVEPYKDKLIVGGKGGLYSYNGTDFTLILSVSNFIKPLGAYGNTFYAGTTLGKPPTLYYCNGSVDNPADWHIDADFSAILNFSGPFGSIDSFAVYNNEMYVASGGIVYSNNGTGWSIAEKYSDVYAFLDMKIYNGKLYLATRDANTRCPFYQNGSGFCGRLIEFDGNNWATVFNHTYWIFSLETYDNKLFVGTANKIYTYNGTHWNTSFQSEEGAYYAVSLITFNNTIYAGMGNGYIFADPSFEMSVIDTIVVPEFPSFLVLPLFMIATLLSVIFYRKKKERIHKSFRDS